MSKKVLIVGGGTAGWLTAGYLARRLGADLPGGASIRLLQSREIGTLGVGEGTFPTIRRTLETIGIDEAEMIRRCGATFKQGLKFVGWRHAPGTAGQPDHYFHGFQVAENRGGLELLPYWLLGAGGGEPWDLAGTPQKRAADANRAPKLSTHPSFVGPLNYAFHFDAASLAEMLRDQAIANGVEHIVDTVTEVVLGSDRSIEAVRTQSGQVYDADLYIDCTGFRAELIGKALGVPFRSCQDTLFCNRAIAVQVPYPQAQAPIASYTILSARDSGWIWDIGLDARRGIGHVYSSDHMADSRAEELLRQYVGPGAAEVDTRMFRFEAGYREINWRKNCVAIGLSSGFFEPLESTGIIFCEVAASLVANLFPWGGDYETSARQFNSIMLHRYERTLDFLKLHYCISKRRDTQFWRDNVERSGIPDRLLELLERWRFRPPAEIDFDPLELFTDQSWQYVLYGMGWKTDLGPKSGTYRYFDEARAAFADVRRQAQFAVANLPSNRDLVEYARTRSFGPEGAAAA